MMIRHGLKNTSGATAVEFGLTAPAFMLMIVGMVQVGMALWTQLGIEHGVEMAARCMVITPSTCDTAAHTQSFAVQQSYGLSVSPSIFTSGTTTTCAGRVQASYDYYFLPIVFKNLKVTLTALSCFPN